MQNNQKSTLKLQEHPPVSQIYKPLSYLTADSYFFPFFEPKKPKKFLITEIKLLCEDPKTLTNDQKFIEKKALEEYLFRRKSNRETRVHLPESLAFCKEEGLRKIIENFDLNNNKMINWKLFVNSMILIESMGINEEIEEEIRGKLGKTTNLEKFVNVKEKFLIKNMFFFIFFLFFRKNKIN